MSEQTSSVWVMADSDEGCDDRWDRLAQLCPVTTASISLASSTPAQIVDVTALSEDAAARYADDQAAGRGPGSAASLAGRLRSLLTSSAYRAELAAARPNWPAVTADLQAYPNGQQLLAEWHTVSPHSGVVSAARVWPEAYAVGIAEFIAGRIRGSQAWQRRLCDRYDAGFDLTATVNNIRLRAHRMWRQHACTAGSRGRRRLGDWDAVVGAVEQLCAYSRELDAIDDLLDRIEATEHRHPGAQRRGAQLLRQDPGSGPTDIDDAEVALMIAHITAAFGALSDSIRAESTALVPHRQPSPREDAR